MTGARSVRGAGSTALLYAVAGMIGLGCGGEATGDGFTVTDSAGVRVATSPAPAWEDTSGWVVADSPSVSIGVARGAEDYQLFRVYHALRLSDGRIVVGNSGTGELRFYDPDGRHIRTIGGQGSGPGEFGRRTIRLCRFEDGRLLASDGANNRYHVFTDRGELVRTTRYGQPPEGVNAWLWGCFADGSLMMGSSMSSLGGRPGQVIEVDVEYLRFGSDGAFRNRLFRHASRPRFVNRAGGVIHYPFIPLTPQPAVATGSEAAYLGLGVDHRIRRYGPDGELEALIEWDGPERPETGALWDRYVDASLEEISPEDTRRRYRRLYSQDLPLPDRVPAYGDRILEDAADNLWVERYRLPWQSKRLWDVFDPEGRWLGAVRTPDRVRVMGIGEDYLLGRHLDELSVERVRLHPIRK